jgi:hypothetical protein
MPCRNQTPPDTRRKMPTTIKILRICNHLNQGLGRNAHCTREELDLSISEAGPEAFDKIRTGHIYLPIVLTFEAHRSPMERRRDADLDL